MVKYLLCACALMSAQNALAISNIENERPNLPENGFSGQLKLGFNGKTGNQEEQKTEAGAKIIYRDDAEIFMALVGRELGSKLSVTNTDNSFLHTRWTHLLSDRWALESFAQLEKDQFDNLTSRILAGGGGRYVVSQEKDIYAFALGLGAFKEYEKLNLVDHEEANDLWRVNSYYSYKYQINEQVSLVNTTYYQPSTTDFGDYRVLFDLGIGVKLTNSLQIKLNYKLTYDSQPAQNLNVNPVIDNFKTNTEYKTSLAYSF